MKIALCVAQTASYPLTIAPACETLEKTFISAGREGSAKEPPVTPKGHGCGA